MKYQNKSFQVYYGSKDYKDNYDDVFGTYVEDVIENDDGTCTLVIYFSDKDEALIAKHAEIHGITFEQMVVKALEEYLQMLENGENDVCI